MSRSIHLQGRDWTQPDTATSWQRERAQPPLTPIAEEFSGRYRVLSWAACGVVGVLFWTAFFCMVLG